MLLQRNHYKWLGLIVALLLPVIMNITGILFISRGHLPEPTLLGFILWGLPPFIILLIILKFGEKEKLSSLGSIQFNQGTVGLGILIMLSMVGVAILFVIITQLLHINHPQEPLWSKLIQYPLWAKLFLVAWAGASEEIYFRGYGITRLQQLTKNKWIASIVPLLIFSIGHAVYGTLYHVLFAFAVGIVLTVSYLKYKNLLANMIAHSMFDFLFIVVLVMPKH